MKLYQIVLPLFHNDGRKSYGGAHDDMRASMIKRAGGYTLLAHGSMGAWRDGNRLYNEPVAVYQVACDPLVKAELAIDALALFSDQKSLFIAELGNVEFIPRVDAIPAAFEKEDAV